MDRSIHKNPIAPPLLKRVRRSDECKYDFVNDCPRKQHQRAKGHRAREIKTAALQDEMEDSILSNFESPLDQEFFMSHDTGKLHRKDMDGNADKQLSNDMNDKDTGKQVLGGDAEVGEQIEISLLDAYIHELKQYGSIAPCDCSMKVFVLQDISLETMQLKDSTFFIVHRKAVFFCACEEAYWIFACSCNTSRQDLLESIPSDIGLSMTAFEETYPTCLHGQAVREIVKNFDSLHAICASSEFSDHTYIERCPPTFNKEIAETESENQDSAWNAVSLCNGKAICVYVGNNYGVVCAHRGKLTCCSCQYGRSSCGHVKSVQEKLLNHPLLRIIRSQLQIHHVKQPKQLESCVSMQSIPFKLTQWQQAVMRQDFSVRFGIKNNIGKLVPNPSPCSLCNSSETNSLIHQRDVTIVSATHTFKAEVYKRCCESPGCEGAILFNSDKVCALDMTSILVVYELLQSFMLHFLLGRCTMYTHYMVTTELQNQLGSDSFHNAMTYNQFRLSWYSYLSLLDIKYEEGFMCSKCGLKPELVIMDGTSLAFRRDLDSWDIVLSVSDNAKDRISGRYSDRVLIPHNKTRQLLIQFVKKGLSHSDVHELKKLVQSNASFLSKLLTHLLMNCEELPSVKCPSTWAAFLESLSSRSAVCAIVHPSNQLNELLDFISTGESALDSLSAEKLTVLQHQVPVLFDLLHKLKLNPEFHCLNVLLAPIISEMVTRANFPFSVPPTDQLSPESPPHIPNEDIAYFPQLSPVRPRQMYTADKTSANKVCTKNRIGHPTLLPGVFTLFCQHGICYGFEVMRVTESPNTAFTLLYTRFESAPKTVIYDNSCNLHNYCLNREPHYFKNTWFLVDRFHWPNHTGCSIGYKMSTYPQFKEVNSQVVEQSNSILKRSKPSLSYMNKINFMNHCKLLLWYHNTKATID